MCSSVKPVEVKPLNQMDATLTLVSPQCANVADGSIRVDITNGTAPVSYQLDSNPLQNSNNTTYTFGKLSSGNYSIQIKDASGCTLTKTTTLLDNPKLKIHISHKDLLCPDELNGTAVVDNINGSNTTAVLNAHTYEWNTKPVQITREAVRLAKGYAVVTVDAKSCAVKDSVEITFTDKTPPKIYCKTDTSVIVLQSASSDLVEVELVKPAVEDNCGIDSIRNDAPKLFKIGVPTRVKWVATDISGLQDSCIQYIYVKVIPTIPKLITPNGDGLNDYFEIDGLKNFPKSQLSVFTRSGQLVFSSNDYKNDWDGKFASTGFSNDQFVSPGVYYYILSLGGTTQKIKGFIYVSY